MFCIIEKTSSHRHKTYTHTHTQVINDPDIYVFGELLQHPSVQSIAKTDDKACLEVLDIFTYKTFAELNAASDAAKALFSKEGMIKLKKISVAEAASSATQLPYEKLKSLIDVKTNRDLEDILIDCIYNGLLKGHLNQKKQCVEVTSSYGRDVFPDEIDKFVTKLDQWKQKTERVVSTLDKQIEFTMKYHDTATKRQDSVKSKVVRKAKHIQKGMREKQDEEMAKALQASQFSRGGRF